MPVAPSVEDSEGAFLRSPFARYASGDPGPKRSSGCPSTRSTTDKCLSVVRDNGGPHTYYEEILATLT